MTDLVPTISTPTDKPSLAVRAVDRLSEILAGKTTTRRRLLYRAAVVGSALAVDPLGYILKPGTAHASVCGSSSSCGGGWSAFCCTINGGANTCPDATYVAGWWKVDASAFCLGAPRYYIDCNRRPNRSCSCRCSARTDPAHAVAVPVPAVIGGACAATSSATVSAIRRSAA